MKRGITRSDFLRGTIASLATTAASPGWADVIAQHSPSSAERPQPSLLDLEFTILEQFRPLDFLPGRFVQIHEQFRKASLTPSMLSGLQSEGHPAQVTHTPGRLRLTSFRTEPTLLRTDARPLAPYGIVIVTMATPEPRASGEGTIAAGLVR